ncbi:MAG: hypothetical protein PHF13_04315 [Acholeplasmataceae bacterium]|nr:hypothetical protein [Acholeplasmataceae bacterium]
MSGYFGAYKGELENATNTVNHSWRDSVSKKYSHINFELLALVNDCEILCESSFQLFSETEKLDKSVGTTVDNFIEGTQVRIQVLLE